MPEDEAVDFDEFAAMMLHLTGTEWSEDKLRTWFDELDSDHSGTVSLEEFFHLEACPSCPYAEWGGAFGYSTLTRQRYTWLLIQGHKRWAENARREKAGLERTPLKPCKPMPGDPQPHFWPGYRWKETYGS